MSRLSHRFMMPMFAPILLFGLGASSASAQQNDAGFMEKHFVSEALKSGLAEVRMGQLAQEKSASDDVKKFGMRMTADHNEFGGKMKNVAQQINEEAPTSPTLLQQVEIKKLEGLSGEQFDREYIRVMVKYHESDLEDFKKEASDGKSEPVRAIAAEGANMIQSHLDLIRSIAVAHNVAVK